MAAKKKSKKAKKSPEKKKSVRKAAKKTVKKVKAAAKKSVRTAKKTSKAAKRLPAKKAAKKKPAVKKNRVMGEGDYAATKKFDADQAGFVKKNKARIPAMGKVAEAALDGPEGKELRAAEAAAAGRSRDTFEP